MATSVDYIEFVMERFESARTGLDLWYRPMFGEYCVYAGEKPLMFVCDNTVFIKKLPLVAPLLEGCDKGEPFPGAKDFVILDVECDERVGDILLKLYEVKPMPKPKKRRKKCTQ